MVNFSYICGAELKYFYGIAPRNISDVLVYILGLSWICLSSAKLKGASLSFVHTNQLT